MPPRESTLRTLLVAGGVALFCSLSVSTVVYWLQPIQLAYRSMDQNRAIVVAAGLARPDEALANAEVVDRYLELEPRLVDLDAGRFTTADSAEARTFDFRSAIDDRERSRVIAEGQDTAGLGRRPFVMPVYLLRDGAALDCIVLPIYGPGMWSTIYGFIGLEADLATVAAVNFYEHGETPGIGDRIQALAWTAQWQGKRAYSADGTVRLRIGAGAKEAAEHVDTITGATVTVLAVDSIVNYWLGEDGYGPFLRRLRAELH